MSQRNHEPVVDALDEVWRSTADACRDLSDDDWDRATDCPGWTVRDNLSHLIGIERMLLGEPAPAFDGPMPGHVRNPIGESNEAWVAERRRRPGADVLAEFEEVTARRLGELAAMEPERFDVVGWSPVGQVPYREFMDIRVLDSWAHEQDVRRAVGRPGGRGGAGESVTLRRSAAAMGYVVAKKVGAPDGTSVAWEVRGPVPTTVAVVVEGGRGRVVDRAPEAPTVRLELDAETFCRLGLGRVRADQLEPGSVGVVGDEGLGRRVLDQMAFMI
ncbi:MAG: maleylpyruvate isomerase family mycothiol-dependent enzyme [Acidimicrobiales bacterium]